jgi:hypothetical protein
MRTLADLLRSIPDEAGRAEILDLGRQVHATSQPARAASGALERKQLLETMDARIRWHFRAARYAIPASEELERMIDEHFGK